MRRVNLRLLTLLLCAALLLPLFSAVGTITADAKGLSKSNLPPYVKEAPAVKESKPVFVPNAAIIQAKSRPTRAIGGGENNGYYTTYTFETFEDLKELASRTYNDRTVFVYDGSASVLTISENLTLPANTSLISDNKVLIPKGITFTTTYNDFSSTFHGLEVKGVFNINASLELYKELTVTGKINLNGNLFLYPDVVITGFDNIVKTGTDYRVVYWHYVDTAAGVYEAIDQANADPLKLPHDIYVQPWQVDEISFTKSFTIPSHVALIFQNATTYTIPSGVTVTVNGTLELPSWGTEIPVLKVSGKLVNNNAIGITGESIDSLRLIFTSTGKYSGNGTLQLNSFGADFEWTDAISGLDPINLEITGGGNWYTIRDITNLTKLSAPSNLTWHKIAAWIPEGDSGRYDLTTRMGAISWNGGEVRDTSNQYQYYYVQIYKDGEPFYWWRYGFTDYFDKMNLPCGIDASMVMEDVEWESGTYYFTVQAIPNPFAENSDYRSSDIVTSKSWTYTKPGTSLATPTNLTWNWPTMSWSGPSGHKYYDLGIFYAKTLKDEPEYVYGASYEMGNSYTMDENDLDHIMEYYGAGYYTFRVRAMSTDITAKYHSAWSTYSDTYYFDGNIKITAPTLKVSNVASTGKIKLTWDAVPGAAKYQVYRATSKTGTYSLLKTLTGTSLTNTSVDVGKTYYYKIRAVDANGNQSEFSSIVSRACDLPQPVVTASNVASTGKVKLTWEAIEGAAKYEVYRATSKDGTYTKLSTTTNTTLTNTSTTAGTTYYYKVKAIHSNSAANSAYSSVVSRACDLPQPTGLTATNVASTGKVKLSWTAVEGAAKYEVYRATSKDGTYTKLSTTTNTTLTNTSTTAGTTYYYKVKAIHSNSAANSAYSSVVSRTCDLPQPTVTVSNVASTGKIKLSWTAVEGAAKYEVYRATSKDGTYTKLSTTTNTTLTNTSTTAGTTYYYKVKAIHSNSAANSAYSSIVSRTCDLAQPTLTVKLNSSGKPVLTWTKVEGAVSYKVYRATSKDGTYSLLKTLTGTSLTNTSVTAGKTYYYKVIAVHSNTAANSAYSAIKSVTVK